MPSKSKLRPVRVPRISTRRMLAGHGLLAPLPGTVAARWGLILGRHGIEPTRVTLLRLRREHGLSRGHLAACLGVGIWTLQAWEQGIRQPGCIGRKMIWLLASMLDDTAPETLEHLATWNRFRRPEDDQSGEH